MVKMRVYLGTLLQNVTMKKKNDKFINIEVTHIAHSMYVYIMLIFKYTLILLCSNIIIRESIKSVQSKLKIIIIIITIIIKNNK